MTDTQRAVRFDAYGGVDVLQVVDVPVPTPGADQVVVAVVTAGINPGEIAIREGVFAEQWPSTFPSGQGSDFAGRIAAVGSGVHAWSIGDEVIGWTDERASHAEAVVVPSSQVTMRPAAVPWDQAGALPIAGATAYAAIRAVHPVEGETVVVTGAAGGVGSIAVQLLRTAGVRVIGVAGPANAEWLQSLGVEPVAHGDGLGHRLRALAPDGIDAFIDTYGTGYVELAVGLGVAPERIDTITDFAGAERLGAKTEGSSEGLTAATLAELAEAISDDELTIPIAARYPLADVRGAFTELAERHTRGKIVLDIGAE